MSSPGWQKNTGYARRRTGDWFLDTGSTPVRSTRKGKSELRNGFGFCAFYFAQKKTGKQSSGEWL